MSEAGDVSWASTPRVRAVMIGNRSRDTRPEWAVRRAVHRRGLRYRVDARPVPAVRRRADLVFSSARVAVFVDGCFWHGCPQHYVASKTNAAWWGDKIERTRQRDLETDELLNSHGWAVVRVWAHEPSKSVAAIIEATVLARSR